MRKRLSPPDVAWEKRNRTPFRRAMAPEAELASVMMSGSSTSRTELHPVRPSPSARAPKAPQRPRRAGNVMNVMSDRSMVE